jgi:hypothetical protein
LKDESGYTLTDVFTLQQYGPYNLTDRLTIQIHPTSMFLAIAIPVSHQYSETCLIRALSKMESCINIALNKVLMLEIFVNLTCIN